MSFAVGRSDLPYARADEELVPVRSEPSWPSPLTTYFAGCTCNSGAGSGRFAEEIIPALSPDRHEVYETASDWLPWLSKLPNVVLQDCDDHTLSRTPDGSVVFRVVRDLRCGAAHYSCESGLPQGRSSRWLPAWLPISVGLADREPRPRLTSAWTAGSRRTACPVRYAGRATRPPGGTRYPPWLSRSPLPGR